MKIIIAALLTLALSTCGGGDSSSSSGAGPLAPVPLILTKAGDGCLVNQNADIAIDYDYGLNPGPRIFEWNCADIGAASPAGVEAFYIFSGSLSCYVERSFRTKAANCAARATAPANPLIAATIEIRGTPSLAFIGGGTYEAIVDLKVTNTGTLTLFGPLIDTSSNPLAFSESISFADSTRAGVGFILPGETLNINGMPMLSANVSPGEAFGFQARARATITDFTALPIASSAILQATAP